MALWLTYPQKGPPTGGPAYPPATTAPAPRRRPCLAARAHWVPAFGVITTIHYFVAHPGEGARSKDAQSEWNLPLPARRRRFPYHQGRRDEALDRG